MELLSLYMTQTASDWVMAGGGGAAEQVHPKMGQISEGSGAGLCGLGLLVSCKGKEHAFGKMPAGRETFLLPLSLGVLGEGER